MLKIRERALGPEHPDLGPLLEDLTGVCRAQGKYTEAEPLFKRALGISEEALGPEHPNVATLLENMAALYRKIGKKNEADMLGKRAKEIRSKQ